LKMIQWFGSVKVGPSLYHTCEKKVSVHCEAILPVLMCCQRCGQLFAPRYGLAVCRVCVEAGMRPNDLLGLPVCTLCGEQLDKSAFSANQLKRQATAKCYSCLSSLKYEKNKPVRQKCFSCRDFRELPIGSLSCKKCCRRLVEVNKSSRNWHPEMKIITRSCFSLRQFVAVDIEIMCSFSYIGLPDVWPEVSAYLFKIMNCESNPHVLSTPLLLVPKRDLLARGFTVGLFPMVLWRWTGGHPRRGRLPYQEILGVEVMSFPLVITVDHAFVDAQVTITFLLPSYQSSAYSQSSEIEIYACHSPLWSHWRLDGDEKKFFGQLLWINVTHIELGTISRPIVFRETKKKKVGVLPTVKVLRSTSTDLCSVSHGMLSEWSFPFGKVPKTLIERGNYVV